jgi:hypothetical protein
LDNWGELEDKFDGFQRLAYPIRNSVVNVSAVPILGLPELDAVSLVEQAQKNPATTSARGLKVTDGFAITRQ